MFNRLKVLIFTLSSASLILFTLCLGSQNLNDRHSINLFKAKTAPLPSGFIIGLSLVTGILTGGSISSLLSDQADNTDIT